jgi:hypothetical protein
MMADIPKVKRNIERLLSAGAPESDIDAYLASEGVTAADLRAAKSAPAGPTEPAYDAMGIPTGAEVPAAGRDAMPYGEQMGNLGRTLDNAVRLAASGATFGLADKFAGGMQALTGNAPSYDAGVKAERARTQAIREANPVSSAVAEAAGGIGTGAGLVKSGVTLAGRLGPALFRRFLGYGAEGAGYGALHGAGNTYSDDAGDYAANAGKGGAMGGIIGGALPVAGRAASGGYRALQSFIGPRVGGTSAGASAMLRAAAQADEQGIRQLASMGDEAMLVDAGPAMLGLGQGAGTGTGSGRTALVNALKARDANTVPRINRDLDAAIGPAPRPSQIEAEIAGNVESVRPMYQGPFNQSRPADTTTIAAELEEMGQTLRGPAQDAVRRVRRYLDVPESNVDPNSGLRPLDNRPESLFQVRQAIDGMLEGETNTKVIGPLSQVRNMVDQELARAVPGIKQVDARFAELMRQREGLQRGGTVFDTGKTATRPADLAEELRGAALPQGEQVGPSAAPARVRQGARAEIDRLVGTNANDLNALERKLGTPQDWNSQKFAEIFGEGPHNSVMQTLMNNRRFRQTYQDIVQNSQTAQRTAAAKAMEGSEGGNVKGDTTMTGLGLRALNAVARAIAGASSSSTKNEIGEILAKQGPEVQRMARELLRTAQKTGENSRAINRVLSSPYWIGGGGNLASQKTAQ